MIAGSLLAVALLALAALAVRTVQDAAHALDHRLATMLLLDLEGRAALIDSGAPEDTLRLMAAAEAEAWRTAVRGLLPEGRAELCLGGEAVSAAIPGDCGARSGAGWMASLQWRRTTGAESQSLALAWTP
jgi:hypothetical protein